MRRPLRGREKSTGASTAALVEPVLPRPSVSQTPRCSQPTRAPAHAHRSLGWGTLVVSRLDVVGTGSTGLKPAALPAKATAARHSSPSRVGPPTSSVTALGAQRTSSTLVELIQRSGQYELDRLDRPNPWFQSVARFVDHVDVQCSIGPTRVRQGMDGRTARLGRGLLMQCTLDRMIQGRALTLLVVGLMLT